MCIGWLYKWDKMLNLQCSLNERKASTNRGIVSFSRTTLLYKLVINFVCEKVTNSRFLYTYTYIGSHLL